jgi:hypothetical protein
VCSNRVQGSAERIIEEEGNQQNISFKNFLDLLVLAILGVSQHIHALLAPQFAHEVRVQVEDFVALRHVLN